jgi:hypothetical protein
VTGIDVVMLLSLLGGIFFLGGLWARGYDRRDARRRNGRPG